MARRPNQLNIRLTDEELSSIADLSWDLSLGKSQFIRLLVRQYLNRSNLVNKMGRNNT